MTKEFGELCRDYRKVLGISGSELARRRVGIDPSYLSRIESGRQEASRWVTRTLLEALEVPPERQAEFLLYAVGYPPKMVEELLIQAKQEINITGDLATGEILEIKITPEGLRVRKT